MGLACENLSLRLQGRLVLDDVSVSLKPGRVTAILGRNGAGKSSLLGCLAGLRKPDGGTVTLDGQRLASMDRQARARRIGLLPQESEVHWDIDVRALVSLGRMPHNRGWRVTAADSAAIDAAMAATDCTRLAERPVRRLSGGEQARVLLARVLAGEPEWLLADEPLASLDPAHQLEVLARLRQVADKGAGVVLVLHDLLTAARVADDVVLLRDGHVLATGEAGQVLMPDMLRAAYGVDVRVIEDATLGRLLVPAAI